MKKFNIFLLMMTLIISLVSCTSNKDKLNPYKINNLSSMIYLTLDEYNDVKESNCDLLFFYGSSSCSTCALAAPMINNYIQSTNIVVFFIETRFYNECNENYESSSLILKKDGEIKEIIPYSPSNYSSQYSFNSIISKYVNSKSNKIMYNDVNDYKFSDLFLTSSINFKTNETYKNAVNNDKNLEIITNTSFNSFNNEQDIYWDKENS